MTTPTPELCGAPVRGTRDPSTKPSAPCPCVADAGHGAFHLCQHMAQQPGLLDRINSAPRSPQPATLSIADTAQCGDPHPAGPPPEAYPDYVDPAEQPELRDGPRCDYTDLDEGQCGLLAGHDGDHWPTLLNIGYALTVPGNTPFTLEPIPDAWQFDRTVLFRWPRGKGPSVELPLRHGRATYVRITYAYDSPGTGWRTTIGPVVGHVYDDQGRLGARDRSLASSRDWPRWLIELAETHQPQTRIHLEETP